MLRVGRAAVVCLAVIFLLSGQSTDQLRGFKIKPGPGDGAAISSVNSGGTTFFVQPGILACERRSFRDWIGNYCPEDLQQQVLMTYINQDRTGVGSPPLQWHSGLAKAAIDHLMTDPPDPTACLFGFSNIYRDLTEVGRILPQEFITLGPFNEGWDVPGRLFGARPTINFTDLGIILARQQLPDGQVGNAATLYFGAIAGNRFTRAIVRESRFTTMGAARDTRLGTWVIVLGEGVTPATPTCNP